MMNIKIVISTMKLENLEELVKRMNLHTDCIIINQTNYNKIEDYKFNNLNIKIVSVNEKGLSKSRNLGLSLLDDGIDFVYFADDDITLYDDIFTNINNKKISAYVFGCNIDGKIKIPKNSINFINSMKLSSIQIVYNVQFLKNNNINFDERFGSGTKIGSGEENIMLFDILRYRAKICSNQSIIAKTNNTRPSTWFKGFNKEFLFNRGAIFTRMSKKYSIFLILQFVIRKYRLYSKENISFLKAVKEMLNGRKYFLELNNE